MGAYVKTRDRVCKKNVTEIERRRERERERERERLRRSHWHIDKQVYVMLAP